MFQAQFFDGLSASAKSVWVEVSDAGLKINVAGEYKVYALAQLDVQAKLGSTKRIVDLPDGARIEADDIGELEATVPSKSNFFWATLHYLENNLGWVIICLCLTVLAGWAFLQHGVPKLAEVVAKATPPTMEKTLGEQVLKGMDHQYGYFLPSKTKPEKQAAITTAVEQLCQVNTCPQYQLTFRDGGKIGANAFALPGGIMVITDGLVELAENDTEIVAVLAHELGHVKQRHAFRQSIQSTLSGLLFAALTGDVSSMASGLPAALMQMRYSRLHELEADQYALAALQQSCLPPQAFADILVRLQKHNLQEVGLGDGQEQEGHGDAHKEEQTINQAKSKRSNPIGDMLSTHPDTMERIKPFIKAKPAC